MTASLLVSGAYAAPITFSAAAVDAAGIQGTVDAFRTALGSPNNGGVPGPLPTGRREINWDGVPDSLAAPNLMPATQFQNRGVLFSTPGSGFQVSADSSNPTSTPIEFENLSAGNSTIFTTFSAQRLFTALDSNITDVTFVVPGSSVSAYTTGFGVVFTDVDTANSTSLQFFDLSNNPLGTFFAPNLAGSETLSFLGVLFGAGEKVGRVRITAGDGPISGPACVDCVAMDDFIYAEPQGDVPEPITMMLTGAGLMGLVIRGRFRRQ